jgi:hypothetical protein
MGSPPTGHRRRPMDSPPRDRIITQEKILSNPPHAPKRSRRYSSRRPRTISDSGRDGTVAPSPIDSPQRASSSSWSPVLVLPSSTMSAEVPSSLLVSCPRQTQEFLLDSSDDEDISPHAGNQQRRDSTSPWRPRLPPRVLFPSRSNDGQNENCNTANTPNTRRRTDAILPPPAVNRNNGTVVDPTRTGRNLDADRESRDW